MQRAVPGTRLVFLIVSVWPVAHLVTSRAFIMSHRDRVRGEPAPPLAEGARGLVRLVCTSNPFYVLSAGLFLAGLWASFGGQSREIDTWALMAGLAGYALLLAVTACLLVRFAGVWDDVRTVLLLVVLMFLATSVTFDEVLVSNPERGLACFVGGLLFAVALSEGVIRGIRLSLPALFRGPYYLVLALFFLYPLALGTLPANPHSEELTWGLFGFSPAAGLVFLTLLPAIRRGPAYVRDNGSPWRWPFYPWALFVVLGLAVPARAFLLCWSMHVPEGGLDRIVFGPYFLVPFGLAIAVLLLEAGLVSSRPWALRLAVAAPAGLVVLAVVGHRPDPIYQGFLEGLADRLGAGPLYLTLLASASFYAYAALRRTPLAAEALTATLVALAVAPAGLEPGELAAPRPLPILAAGMLQFGLGLRRRHSWRCLLGGACVVGAVVLALPEEIDPALRAPIAFHLALIALFLVGAEFDDALGRALRVGGGALVLLACLAATFGSFEDAEGVAPWALIVYPLVLAAALAAYGLVLGHRPSLSLSALALACWLGAVGWQGYAVLREVVTGLDHMVLGLVLLGLAVLVSLAKSGALSRWVAARGWGLAPDGRRAPLRSVQPE